MRSNLLKYIFKVIFTACFIFSSCTDEGEEGRYNSENIVTTISVECVQPGFASLTSRVDNEAQYPGDVSPIIIDSFNEQSRIYISQMGASVDPNFTDLDKNAASYCYIYQFFENEEAIWEYEYNFKTVEDRNPIDWIKVRSLGSVGNAFSFFSFYFPNNESADFSVKLDQTGDDPEGEDQTNFKVSDIMGAYHATSALYSRLRFRLYHLMVYIKVTLYVPVYESTVNNSDYNYSGFNENAIVGAYVLNAYPGIQIEWHANRSSDIDPPLTQPTGKKSNIAMYFHKPDNEVYPLTGLQQYYPAGDKDTDQVRAYNFSVLIPGQSFDKDDFLCFVLRDTDGEYRYYYMNSNSLVGSTGELGLIQGTLQQIYLYVPRKTNETILIGANILPWSNGVTDMTVTKDKEDTLEEDFLD